MTVMINLTNGLTEGGRLSEKELNTRLQIRNATVAEFNSSNPVLLKGELIAVNEDGDYRLKIGDGTSNFSQLQFLDAPLRTLIEGKANANHTHFTATTGMSGFMSSTDKAKLDGIDNNANNYTHPSYTARNSGLYKITVNSLGHVTAASSVTKSDITALGIPAEDTNTTYGLATVSTPGLMSAADKSKLNSLDISWIYAPHPTNRTATTCSRNTITVVANRTIYLAGIHYVWLEFWADLPSETYMAVYIRAQRRSQDYELAASTYQSAGVQAGIVSGFFPLQASDYLHFDVYHDGNGNVNFRWRYGILRLKNT